MVRVYVELPEELDVGDWARRHEAGQVPDHAPYGLHQIADDDCAVAFRTPMRMQWCARKVRNHTDSTEIVAALRGLIRHEFAGADAVLCMDERTGLPAALTPGGPPVVSGIAWLDDPANLRRCHAMLARRGLNRMAAVFTQSPALAPILRDRWHVAPERIHDVTLGIDPEFYPEQPWPQEFGETVVSVGDDRMRDHLLLVDALERVRLSGVDVRLELATTLPIRVPAELGVLHARRMGARMRELYRRASVVAVALRENNNGSGLTVALEAMASGRPLVITDAPGVSRYVRHGVTGLLVPPGDTDAFADAVRTLLKDPQLAKEMGAAGRHAVLARFTTAQMARELRSIIRAL